jgi:TonB family protein
MYRLIPLLALFLPFTLIAQKLKLKVEKFDNYRIEYHVSKENKLRKEGGYEKIHSNGNTLVEGQYKKGSRDSIWTFYSDSGLIKEKGAYKFGQKVGEWEYYGAQGALERKYNFTSQQLTFYDPEADTITHLVRSNGELKRVRLHWPAIYTTGEEGLWDDIQDLITYPEKAVDRNIQGTVQLVFWITEKGQLEGLKVSKSVHELLDNESIRVIHNLPKKWLPAKYDGKPVAVQLTIPMEFIL